MRENAKFLTDNFKGILAADESSSSIKKKLEKNNIQDTVENHRRYREMLFSTPEIENYISGVIMYDETFRQSNSENKLFPEYLQERGILPGIKVDLGKIDAPNFRNESITQGFDGLRERFKEYASLGAKFSKWRAVINVGVGMPSRAIVESNANTLAIYAALAQEAGIVPIVEPEVLADGDHSIDDCELATHTTLDIVFEHLMKFKVDLKAMLLKPNMIIQGIACDVKNSPEEIAQRTLRVFEKTVPKDVAGIVFLSGGQSPEEATNNLAAVSKISQNAPWPISFSYGRALQDDALAVWAGRDENVATAQEAFKQVAKRNSDARRI